MSGTRFTLNGKTVEVAQENLSALQTIRDEMKVKSPKLVCGVGGCGACVVLVDGVPTETCTSQQRILLIGM